MLEVVSVSTMKYDVLWSAALLILHELGSKPHTMNLVSVAFFGFYNNYVTEENHCGFDKHRWLYLFNLTLRRPLQITDKYYFCINIGL